MLATMAFANAADDEPLPSGAWVLDHYIEVTGGKDAYAKHRSEIQSGVLEFPAQGLKAKIIRYAAEPDKYATSVEIPGVGKIESGVTAGIAWDNSAVLGPRIKSGEEKARAIREAVFNATLNWRKVFTKVDNAGVEPVDGEECYKLIVSPSEGRPDTMYFSKKSGLLLKVTAVAVSQMGEIPVEMSYSGYKEANGIRFPSVIGQKAVGQEFTVTIDEVRVNEDIPADKFALPAEIKALRDKAAK
jgi:hypothetical protein